MTKSNEDQMKAVLTLINNHGGFARAKRILEGYERNMTYRKNRQRDLYSDAKAWREQEAARKA